MKNFTDEDINRSMGFLKDQATKVNYKNFRSYLYCNICKFPHQFNEDTSEKCLKSINL